MTVTRDRAGINTRSMGLHSHHRWQRACRPVPRAGTIVGAPHPHPPIGPRLSCSLASSADTLGQPGPKRDLSRSQGRWCWLSGGALPGPLPQGARPHPTLPWARPPPMSASPGRAKWPICGVLCGLLGGPMESQWPRDAVKFWLGWPEAGRERRGSWGWLPA